MLNKGYIYLDSENASNLSNSLNAFLISDVVNIGTGNWAFKKLSETSSIVTIELKKVGANIHQLSWQDLKSTLKSFIGFSSANLSDPERSILENIYKNIKGNPTFSPSETRNFLNYVSEIAIDEIESKIFCPQVKIENFIKTLTKLNYNKSLSSNIMLSIIIGQYLYLLNGEIIKDLQNRNPKHFKLLDKLTKS